MAIKYIDTDLVIKISNGYHGSGGFLDGSYLTQAPAETPEKFIYRQSISEYDNAMKMIVDANITPIFDGVTRNIEDANELTLDMMQNIDGSGTNIRDYFRIFGTEADLLSFMIAFWDSGEQGDVMSTASNLRLVKIRPQEIYDYELASENNLRYFSYKSDEDAEGAPIYTIYENGEFYTGQYVKKEGITEIIELTERVPALHQPQILHFQPYEEEWTLPLSSYTSLISQVQSIYDISSLLSYQCAQSTFGFLHTDDQNIGKDDMALNENSLVRTQEGTGINPILFPNAIPVLQQRIDSLKSSMYMDHNLAVLSTSANASGESRRESDKIRISSLKNKSQIMNDFEVKMIHLYQQLIEESQNYECLYPSDFSSNALIDYAEITQTIIDTGISPENAARERAKLLIMANPNATQEDKDEIIASELNNIVYVNDLDGGE